MKVLRIFLLLLILPAVPFLAHDAYIFYENQEKGFKLSAAGFLWDEYERESHRQFIRSLDKEQLDIVGPILRQKAVYLGLAAGGFIGLIYLVFALISSKSESSGSTRKGKNIKLKMERKNFYKKK